MTFHKPPIAERTHDLHGSVAQRILESAVAAQALVRIRPDEHTPAREIPARLVAGDETTLTLRLPPGNRVFETLDPVCALSGSVRLEDRVYTFTTYRVQLAEPGAGQLLGIARPTVLTPAERRRSNRKSFRLGARVELRRVGTLGGRGQVGELLNLSVGGLSCRVPRTQADRFQVDAGVQLRLAVVNGDPVLELPGRVCSVTHSADAKYTLLGIMFLEGDELQAARPSLDNLTGAHSNVRYQRP